MRYRQETPQAKFSVNIRRLMYEDVDAGEARVFYNASIPYWPLQVAGKTEMAAFRRLMRALYRRKVA